MRLRAWQGDKSAAEISSRLRPVLFGGIMNGPKLPIGEAPPKPHPIGLTSSGLNAASLLPTWFLRRVFVVVVVVVVVLMASGGGGAAYETMVPPAMGTAPPGAARTHLTTCAVAALS